jgi:hypothetical protein
LRSHGCSHRQLYPKAQARRTSRASSGQPARQLCLRPGVELSFLGTFGLDELGVKNLTVAIRAAGWQPTAHDTLRTAGVRIVTSASPDGSMSAELANTE